MLADRQFLAVQMLKMSTASGHSPPGPPPGPISRPLDPTPDKMCQCMCMFDKIIPIFNNIGIKMADFHALCTHF